MQFLAHFLPLLGLFVFAVAYGVRHRRRTPRKGSRQAAPEPPGALPVIGHLHLLRGQVPIARTLGAMAEKHGPIFSLRLGRRHAVVVSSPEEVKECFTTNDRNFATRPPSALTKYIGFDGVGFALAPYGAYWREIRKMVNLELFGVQPLQKLRQVWESESACLVRDLHSVCRKQESYRRRTAVVNLTEWLEQEMCNVTVRILSGKRLSDEDRKVKESIKKGLYLAGVFVVSDFIPGLEWMDVGGYLKALRQTAKELDAVAGKWLEEHLDRKGDGGNEADFVSVMLSTLAEDTSTLGYTRDAIIRATVVILIMTGTESSSVTMIWALSALLNHPDALKAVQDELDVHVGRNRWADESDIKNLEYLQAVVKETLRMYPPGPLAGPHEALEDCYVRGYYVPKGTRLVVNVWQLHHDPRVWPEPHEFRPERFLVENTGVGYQGQSFEYIPFSSGRRMCPASTFAQQVIHLTLARLIQGFELSAPMGEPLDMNEGLGIALPKVKPLEAILSPRLSSELYTKLV